MVGVNGTRHHWESGSQCEGAVWSGRNRVPRPGQEEGLGQEERWSLGWSGVPAGLGRKPVPG